MEQAELKALMLDELVEKRLLATRNLSQLDSVTKELFLLALGDEDWRVRKEATSFFMQQPDTGQWIGFIVDLLAHPDNAGLRNAAIEILIGLGSQVVGFLLNRLSVSDAEVRKFIVDILGEIGHQECAAELLPYLHDDDENVRYSVVETIGKVRSVSAVGALLDLLETSDAGLQFTVFEALSSICEGVPVARILPYAQNALLRKSVFNCLGQLGSAEAIPELLKGLSDPLRKTREVALLSFGQLVKSLPVKDCPEVDQQSGQVVEGLINYLHHDRLDYRRAACYVLSLFPNTRVVGEMLPLLADEDLRSDVVAAAKLIPQVILSALVKTVSLDDENALYLIFLMGELGYAEIGKLAIEAVQSDDPQFRYAAAMTLGNIAVVEATALLSDALADDVPEIREAASEALCQIGRREPTMIIKTVAPYLEASDVSLRLLAVRTLGALPTESVENFLLLALKDVTPEIRCEALRGLAGFRSPRLLSGLSLALTDEVADVRRLAAVAIGAFPAQRSTLILDHALDDSDPWVRMAAIKSLTEGDEQALLLILERGLSDPVGLVVIAALETTQRLLPSEVGRFLQTALNHEDEEVVSTAVRLLLASAVDTPLLVHDRPIVRLLTINQLKRSTDPRRFQLLEERLECEQDPQVRLALEEASRNRKVGG